MSTIRRGINHHLHHHRHLDVLDHHDVAGCLASSSEEVEDARLHRWPRVVLGDDEDHLPAKCHEDPDEQSIGSTVGLHFSAAKKWKCVLGLTVQDVETQPAQRIGVQVNSGCGSL